MYVFAVLRRHWEILVQVLEIIKTKITRNYMKQKRNLIKKETSLLVVFKPSSSIDITMFTSLTWLDKKILGEGGVRH